MLRFLTFVFAVASAGTVGGAPLIELTAQGVPVQGRQIAHDKHVCWLTDLDGRLLQIPLETVTDFRQVAPEFEARPLMDVKKSLTKEFGTGFEVAIRGRYVVCAPRGKADQFASLFDQTSRDFLQYLKVRRFKLTDPDLPLVAVVFPSRSRFVEQCAKDDVPVGGALRGYYDQRSNRVTLYDDPLETSVAISTAGIPNAPATKTPAKQAAGGSKPSVEANAPPSASADQARDTAVHEAIHQLAFNTGLHTRVGDNPIWVVEGLAMQFERGPGGLVKTPSSERVNLIRLKSFDDYRRERRQGGFLAQMIAGDESFKKSPLDAYGTAWTFTNYLIETRPQKYGWYLQTLAARNPLTKYSAEDRLTDFKANFGEDLAWLEVEFLRYAEKLSVEALSVTEGSTKK